MLRKPLLQLFQPDFSAKVGQIHRATVVADGQPLSLALQRQGLFVEQFLKFGPGFGLGKRIYLAAPRRRGLLALNLAAAAGAAIVFVNTIVIVRVAL